MLIDKHIPHCYGLNAELGVVSDDEEEDDEEYLIRKIQKNSIEENAIEENSKMEVEN